MNNEEIQALMGQLRDAGLSEEDIADGVLWPMYREGKISREDLATLCSAIGLELDEDFDKDPTPDPIDAGKENPTENVTKEEAEEAKEIKPGESKEEFKEKVENAKESPVPDGSESDDDDEEDEEEWDSVKKNIFKL